MGGLISKARLILYATAKLNETYDFLLKQIYTPPGIPVQNPTQPLWTIPAAQLPPNRLEAPPDNADVVIIGSGITGTSVAYNVLALAGGVKIVMLDSRDVCSGATGRNGGHINPPLYEDYNELKEQYGEHAAKLMIAFRQSHITEFLRIASAENILKQSQCRETEHVEVYTCPKAFATAKENLEKWRAEMPVESSSFVCYEGPEASEKFHLSSSISGCIANPGGAMHPYRFVTSLLSILLSRHPDNFNIFTHTPCTSITTEGDYYTVHTPASTIRTPHVVHATNGWCANLLRPLLAKIAPSRGQMSAQRPGSALHSSTLSGLRSFVFDCGSRGYDYLTQLPDPDGEHELMFGGGWAISRDDARGLPEIGIADDSVVNHVGQSYLAGALPNFFGLKNWGRDVGPKEGEGNSDDGEIWAMGRTKAQWSGILGISADKLPWVGRLPENVSGRQPPISKVARRSQEKDGCQKARTPDPPTAAPGEWLAAGYSGEGMVHAWMSGKALAYMLLDREAEIEEWFPDILRVTEGRWKTADMTKLFERYF